MFANDVSQEHYSDETYQAVMDCLSPEARIVALGDGITGLKSADKRAILVVGRVSVRLIVDTGVVLLPAQLSHAIKADARLA